MMAYGTSCECNVLDILWRLCFIVLSSGLANSLLVHYRVCCLMCLQLIIVVFILGLWGLRVEVCMFLYAHYFYLSAKSFFNHIEITHYVKYCHTGTS